MTKAPASLDCYAIVAPGLETYALAEARALGLDARVEDGGIAWNGDADSVLRANLGLRIASRVVVRMARFRARTFFELERHARRIDWARVIHPGESVQFRVTSKKSRLYHSDAVAQRFAAAVSRAIPGVTIGDRIDDEGEGDARGALIIVRFMRDECTVSADASGELLHRRGYREAVARAPLRETLAAAMIAASEWDRRSPLVDPFCGSGTIPIEAAMLARDLAPGHQRVFAMEGWPFVAAAVGSRTRALMQPQHAIAGPLSIAGFDRDAGAIAASRANADRAGVAGDLTFEMRAISALELPAERIGWIVTNPPYGVRVGDAREIRDLWARFGQVLRERAAGWHVTLLSPDAALERQLGIPLRQVAKTANGGIPVRILSAIVP